MVQTVVWLILPESEAAMSFQSLAFFGFLAAVIASCLLAGRRSLVVGKILLSAACLVFYLNGVSRPLMGFAVLFLGMAVTLAATGALCAGKNRRTVFAAAAGWHIAVLLIFKYTGFFTGGALRIGWAPVGLSFFTFQQLWYLKEVYTGEYTPAKTGLSGAGDFFLYTFFFPSVTSGPILRPGTFLPQLQEPFRPDWQDAATGIYSICAGTVKKVLLADSFAVIVNNGWAYEESISAVTAWMMILGYTLQLYFDFSGYCDIALGAARLLGIRLPVNFDSPYRSLSVTEFWKRWHITLTTFLRECLYFPLGGSRKGVLRTYLNILIVFLVSGFWHGAGWTFIVWGALHGLAQVTERILGQWPERFPKLLRWGMTFLFLNLAWVFFRAPDVGSALTLLRTAFTPDFSLPAGWLVSGLLSKEVAAVGMLLPSLSERINVLLMAVLYGAGMLVVAWPRSTAREMENGCPGFLRSALLAVMTAWAIMSFTGVGTFIYSNF